MHKHILNINDLGLRPYTEVYEAMIHFTKTRTPQTPDALWLCEHHPVYTLGRAGDMAHIRTEHLSQPSDQNTSSCHNIPIIRTDRGGQVTYHGPGQWVLYPLVELKRYNLNLSTWISLLEKIIIDALGRLDIVAYHDPKARGIYTNKGEKIASIGLRISKGCSYHGIALNVDMDLTPFSWIDPCGNPLLKVTQVTQHTTVDLSEFKKTLINMFCERLSSHTSESHLL